MTRPRFLIVNADDFGLSRGINRGIIHAHEHGIVTSASLMVRWPASSEAAALAGTHPRLSVGLHVDMGEWVFRDGEWTLLYEVLPPDASHADIKAEAQRQLGAFREIIGKNPTHIDSHQHVHRDEPLRSILAAFCAEMEIPLRSFSPAVSYRGDFYGRTGKGEPYPDPITVAGLLQLLTSLEPGVTELGCHPGLGEDFDSVYRAERALEVGTLCDPQVRDAIVAETITLGSFCDAPAR